MSLFLRLLKERDKAAALKSASVSLRQGDSDPLRFAVEPKSFEAVPGSRFAYWVSGSILRKFSECIPLSTVIKLGKGPDTGDDFRFLRLNWEVNEDSNGWINHPKGGEFSPYYSDVHLVINWADNGQLIALVGNMRNPTYMLRPGLTWSRRTSSELSMRVLPEGCIFADKGPAGFDPDDDPDRLLALVSLANSRPFKSLVELQLAAADAAARSYEVGIIQNTPIPSLTNEQRTKLAGLARRACSLKRTADSVTEASHAFVLPAALRVAVGTYERATIEVELDEIKAETDKIAFDLYGFSEADRDAVNVPCGDSEMGDTDVVDDQAEEQLIDGLLTWSVGIAFGRFDLQLATGERAMPPEPEPFDPLPTKSPGMLPGGAQPFHTYTGILVDDQGHPHDLVHVVEQVIGRVNMPAQDNVRKWLQNDFFAFHLKQYSKSRRKAPIYWPLSTLSGSYTLWLYYPSLSSQTLYTAVNDFIDPKLKQVMGDLASLRNKGNSRSRNEEKELENLHVLELDLIELREILLQTAPTYEPNHDDGVQITAAPLWPLFQHKPWKKLLKNTWDKLENGDYDWSNLAMNYWPDRVREKCKTNRSLAIAHGREDL